MKDLCKFAFILTVVSIIATTSLAWVYNMTREEIEMKKKEVLQQGLKIVLSGSGNLEITDHKTASGQDYYLGMKGKKFAGFAILSTSVGYADTIKTLVGMDSSGTILAINVLSQKETPGLGTQVQAIRSGETVPWWQAQFYGKKANEVALTKDNGSIEAVTGATITSRAITDGISKDCTSFLESLESGS